jgi:hypothetical protein
MAAMGQNFLVNTQKVDTSSLGLWSLAHVYKCAPITLMRTQNTTSHQILWRCVHWSAMWLFCLICLFENGIEVELNEQPFESLFSLMTLIKLGTSIVCSFPWHCMVWSPQSLLPVGECLTACRVGDSEPTCSKCLWPHSVCWGFYFSRVNNQEWGCWVLWWVYVWFYKKLDLVNGNFWNFGCKSFSSICLLTGTYFWYLEMELSPHRRGVPPLRTRQMLSCCGWHGTSSSAWVSPSPCHQILLHEAKGSNVEMPALICLCLWVARGIVLYGRQQITSVGVQGRLAQVMSLTLSNWPRVHVVLADEPPRADLRPSFLSVHGVICSHSWYLTIPTYNT